MTETQKLPLTFGERHETSDANPLLGTRHYEVRTLSNVYLPEEAEARIEKDILIVEYMYDTRERPGFTYQNRAGFSIQFGRETKRVLSLSVSASRIKVFRTNMNACNDFLKKQLGTASEQRHYIIIADTLEILKDIVLTDYFQKRLVCSS